MDLCELSAGGMPADAIDERDRHPWERARADFVEALLEEAAKAPSRQGARSAATLLDIGSGDAYVASRVAGTLPPGSTVTCWDSAYSTEQLRLLGAASPALAFTRERPSTRFSVLLLLDVLEHVKDDHAFLGDLVRTCAHDGALVIVTVPAWPSLYGEHDRFLHHHRRYAPSACARLLREAGLTIERDGGLFASLLPARAAVIAAERHRMHRPVAQRGVAGGWRRRGALGALARAWLRGDAAVCRHASRLGLPLPGLSYFAVCTKR